eukprot:TRINITY_DN2533_c0_g2_i1.p1 TRINITY_DN2533_c0_g2~~TRINITY_DN2533_c0_g2_i1.p1  ORF type:complete len:865 (+),score=255.01 TRINITY_DN2533_c0_g2_i1:162-2756(+)
MGDAHQTGPPGALSPTGLSPTGPPPLGSPMPSPAVQAEKARIDVSPQEVELGPGPASVAVGAQVAAYEAQPAPPQQPRPPQASRAKPSLAPLTEQRVIAAASYDRSIADGSGADAAIASVCQPAPDRRPGSAPAVLTPTQAGSADFSAVAGGLSEGPGVSMRGDYGGQMQRRARRDSDEDIVGKPLHQGAGDAPLGGVFDPHFPHGAAQAMGSRQLQPGDQRRSASRSPPSAPPGVPPPPPEPPLQTDELGMMVGGPGVVPDMPEELQVVQLRAQQQLLAHQLRALQQQEMHIMQRQYDDVAPYDMLAQGPPLDGRTDDVILDGQVMHMPDVGMVVPGGHMMGDGGVLMPHTMGHPHPHFLPAQGRALDVPQMPPQPEATMFDGGHGPPGHRLDTLRGQILGLIGDQRGRSYITKLLDDENEREVTIIYEELIGSIAELAVDANHGTLLQRLFETCNDDQLRSIVHKIAGSLQQVAVQSHGARAVQKLVDAMRTQEQIDIFIKSLAPQVVSLIKDVNGNHVVQKCLQKFDGHNQFVYDAVASRVQDIATHRHGCCILQRCIDFGSADQKMQLVSEIINHGLALVQDPFGNYVVQYILDMEMDFVNVRMIRNFIGNIAPLSMNKFSSNVIEKCLRIAPDDVRQSVMEELVEPSKLQLLLQDQFANYVVQTALNTASAAQFQMLAAEIRPLLHTIKNTPHGKKIEGKINRGHGPSREGADQPRHGRRKGRVDSSSGRRSSVPMNGGAPAAAPGGDDRPVQSSWQPGWGSAPGGGGAGWGQSNWHRRSAKGSKDRQPASAANVGRMPPPAPVHSFNGYGGPPGFDAPPPGWVQGGPMVAGSRLNANAAAFTPSGLTGAERPPTTMQQ